MKTLLTIDFDFFIPEDPMWDMGHNESPFFMNFIWYTRSNLMDEMKTNGMEKGFWERLQGAFKFETDTVHVSESHLEAFHLTPPLGRIINIDRHHDVWEAVGNRVDCATWGLQAMRLRHAEGMTWVHPTDGGFETTMVEDNLVVVPPKYRKRIEPMTLQEALVRLKGTRIDAVHVCRSAAWTPPWLDGAFDEFLSGSPFPNLAPVGALDIKRRWSEEDFEKAREHKALVKSFYTNQAKRQTKAAK